MQAYITGIALLLGFLPAFSQQADSLAWYLEIAARNNPLVNSNFALYKASLEKIPQAGAYEDPELDIGVFVKPMETLSGKQIADFTLMQMFPWFGTRKAARNEATEMSRMAYEQFREARNNLFYEVKSQWYQLCNLNEQYKNTQANLALLEQLEKLALNRYSAPSANAPASTVTPITGNAVTPPALAIMILSVIAWSSIRKCSCCKESGTATLISCLRFNRALKRASAAVLLETMSSRLF